MQLKVSWLPGAGLMAAAMLVSASPTDTAVVQVTVPGKAPLALDHAALAKLPQAEVMAGAHDTPKTPWQGTLLTDVVIQAGAVSGKQLRGRTMASYVRVTATDGYQVVFAVADLDADFGKAQVLLVDRHNGKPLAEDGPFRLIVPGDARPARWVRNVRTIEVVDGGTESGKTGH